MSITKAVKTEDHLGNQVPVNPWKLGMDIQCSQDTALIRTGEIHTVLFNKGRYFETTIHDANLRRYIAQAIKSKIKYKTMIVDSWRKLEAFVKAMNNKGYYIKINIDWI